MNSNDSVFRSERYAQQSTQPSQLYQQERLSAQARVPNFNGADFPTLNSQTTAPNIGFFTPQTAFYGPSNSQPTSMSFLSDNAFLNVGFNVVEQGMRDITGKTAKMLPNEMKKSLSSIKYYFAVDHTYVFKKLCLLMFPFRSRNWSLDYNTDKPIPPRFDTNAPDYYIPLMSALTYVLVAGLILGTQNKFTPEQLGMHATSALIWNIIELSILCLIFYIFNIQSKLCILDLIAYCGYKYVGMTAVLSFYLLTDSVFFYYLSLLYVSISLSYFLILPDIGGSKSYSPNGNTHRIYLLLSIALVQPFFIWYLTRHLIGA